MSKFEYCCKCGDATGKAGAGDDSLYTDSDGPFCEDCYSRATPSPANGAVGEMPVAFIAPRLLESLSNYREAAPSPSNFSVAVQAGQRNGEDLPLYSADQLRAAVLAEREQIAKMAENTNSHGMHIADLIRART